MEFLNMLGINSTAGVIGIGLVVIGGFLILTGFDIISIEKVTVKSGKRTWIIGIIFAIIGLVFLIPEFMPSTPPIASQAVITPEIIQSNCGTLKLDTISPPAVLESKSREYKLLGSGFCNDTAIFISGSAWIGNSPQSTNSQPVEVSSDGTWLTVYINPVSAPDQSGSYIMVENPDGNTVSLFVYYER